MNHKYFLYNLLEHMFADSYLNSVIYSGIGNLLVMISVFSGRERW